MNVDQRQRIEQEIARAAATGLIEAGYSISVAWLHSNNIDATVVIATEPSESMIFIIFPLFQAVKPPHKIHSDQCLLNLTIATA